MESLKKRVGLIGSIRMGALPGRLSHEMIAVHPDVQLERGVQSIYSLERLHRFGLQRDFLVLSRRLYRPS